MISLLRHTSANIDNDNTIEIKRGVPQGAVLSPSLFNLYVDDLLGQIEEAGAKVLAFADDIVFTISDTTRLLNCIRVIERWTETNDIKINNSKSAIIHIRADNRTPTVPYESIRGIPIKKTYTYLGVTLDDCLNFTPAKQKLSKYMGTMKKTMAYISRGIMPQKLVYQAWQTLVSSKFNYALDCIG